jgi:hypothetical protein
MRRGLRLLVLAVLVATPSDAAAEDSRPFRIEVVDRDTRRGVPLVTLRTVHALEFVTDSAGVVAFDEPGLLGRRVHFTVESPGYELPADGFGIRGVALDTAPGGRATVEVVRTQIAERLYRVTGAGIYRDTVLTGGEPPIVEPLLAADVVGQDSVQAVIYRERIHWFWGDTLRASYPLGHFATAGAASCLPGRCGLDPEIGVELTYFAGPSGFSRPMCPLPEPGMVWIDAVLVLPDPTGRPRLVAHYSRMKSLGERLEHGLAVYDDEADLLRREVAFPQDMAAAPRGHPFRVRTEAKEWIYFASPYPEVRVEATWKRLLDPGAYEAYTCLVAGGPGRGPKVERAPGVRWAWRRGGVPCGPERQRELLRSGELREEEVWTPMTDAGTGKPVLLHSGSIRWNRFRGRWVMLAVEAGGSPSYLGEVWYSEAPTPIGPWVAARRVATHPGASFYNPVHHVFFDGDGGRRIRFEGTWSHTFSGNPRRVPRYDYNQIMYGLSLDDPRLALPEPPAGPSFRRDDGAEPGREP